MNPHVGVAVWLAVALGAALTGLAARRSARARWRWVFVGPAPTDAVRGRPGPRSALAGTGPRSAIVAVVAAALAVLLGAGAGLFLGGPVAAAALAGYAGGGAWFVRRVGRRRRLGLAYRGAVEAVAAVCADLRAGVAVGPALGAVGGAVAAAATAGGDAARVTRRLAAAVHLAESSGAPLADVLDRLDTHLRAVDRVRAGAAAQAAGARASATLLAALPVAGVGLGAAVGADSWRVLLHTPIGAACLAGAAVLQLIGMAWTVRLVRVDVSP
jgi:tight adherence protein B